MESYLLTLVRHAKSSWRFGDLDDHSRPLNARGLADCQRMPPALAARFPVPDLLLVSDATRTIQTAESIAKALALGADRLRVREELYLADPGTMLSCVQAYGADHRHVMLVGHNPGITDLFIRLSGRPLENMPTFGVGHLGFAIDGWARLPDARADSVELLFPKQLKGAD